MPPYLVVGGLQIPGPNLYTAIKELYPIVIALELWGKYMVNSKVLFLSDNQAVVDVLNMRLIRRLVLCTLSYNIVFRAKHSCLVSTFRRPDKLLIG